MERHSLFEGRIHLYRRPGTNRWHCSTSLNGTEHRTSTRQEILEEAKVWAEAWYFALRGQSDAGLLGKGKTFEEAAEQFRREYPILTEGQRSERYIESLNLHLDVNVLPFFRGKPLAAITGGTIQEYRLHRAEKHKVKRAAEKKRAAEVKAAIEGGREPPSLKPLARSSISSELIVIRHVLKTALRHKWISSLPDLSVPYKMSGKVGHRAWFSPDEYKRLYTATRKRAKTPLKSIWKEESLRLHDFVLFMANTGLRPDEAWRLEYRDVHVVRDEATDDVILEIEVRGKRGVGHCKSMPGAVAPLRRLRARSDSKPTDRLFPTRQRELFNSILEEQGLKHDRDGNARTAYSLRHTYICFRLIEGADIYQVAKNCRTSVEMIEKHYAIHLKNTLDAASINVRRDKPVSRRLSNVA